MIKVINKDVSHIVPIKKSSTDISYLMPNQQMVLANLDEIQNYLSIKEFLRVISSVNDPVKIDKKKKGE